MIIIIFLITANLCSALLNHKYVVGINFCPFSKINFGKTSNSFGKGSSYHRHFSITVHNKLLRQATNSLSLSKEDDHARIGSSDKEKSMLLFELPRNAFNMKTTSAYIQKWAKESTSDGISLQLKVMWYLLYI